MAFIVLVNQYSVKDLIRLNSSLWAKYNYVLAVDI